MRAFISLSLIVIFSFSLGAQDLSEAKKIPTNYDRSSLAIFFLDFGSGNYYEAFKTKLQNIVVSDKYDNNNFGDRFMVAPYSRTSVPSTPQDDILNELVKNKTGLQIIGKWYSRQPDGTMSLELVHQRGRFSATDADYLKAQTSKRGNAALEDYGNRLVNLSYVLVVDVQNLQTMSEAGMSNLKGYKATSVGYLYKINFDDETRNAFYDTWIYDDDTDAVKAEKLKKFEELDIPLTYVTQKTAVVTASQPKTDSGVGLLFKPKSDDELLQELAQKCYEEVIYLIERDVEEFKVKTSIYSTRPIKAKIGLKEGLKADYRFFVYEFVYNEKKGKAEPVRRGVIRAKGKSKIVDNRKEASGDMGTSQFYQVAGRKLEAGFTLQQQNDLGIEVIVAGEAGNTKGFYARVDYRMGRFIGLRSLFVFGEGGIDGNDYDGDTYAFLRYGAGIAKGLQLMRNVELRPYVGAGLEQTSSDNINSGDAISSLYFRAGANLALNLKHNFQVVGGMGLYQFIGDATDSEGNSMGQTWDQYFPDRSGPAALIGVKIMF